MPMLKCPHCSSRFGTIQESREHVRTTHDTDQDR